MRKSSSNKNVNDSEKANLEKIKIAYSYSNSYICLGVEMGVSTFNNIINFSGLAIGFIITFSSFKSTNLNLVSKIFIILSLVSFFLAASLSLIRNYYAGHEILLRGKRYDFIGSNWFQEKIDKKNLSYNDHKKYDDNEDKISKYDNRRIISSWFARGFFVVGILLTIISFMIIINI